jgi:nuclear pore complex protein Nup107
MERISEGDKNVKNNSIREHMGYECLLNAHTAYNIWKFNHHKKPEAPLPPIEGSAAEKIDYETKFRAYTDKAFAIWHEKDKINSQLATKSILQVLHFENGWMLDLDNRFHTGDENDRLAQMKRIRQKCIPELCFMLQNVLYHADPTQHSIDLAAIVADEHHRLYTTFKQDELQKLLELFCQCTLTRMQANNTT